MGKVHFTLSPTEHPVKRMFVEKDEEGSPLRDPITMEPYNPIKGIVEIQWEETLHDKVKKPYTKLFKLHLDPDTFAQLKTNSAGQKINPYTQQPITHFKLISPPHTITAATKVIQRHTRRYLKKKEAEREANQDPTTLLKNYGIRYKLPQYRTGMVGLTYKGKLFRLDFGADWKPKRAPKVITLKKFDWKHYRELPSDKAEDQYLSHFLCTTLKKHQPHLAPGDIIDMDYEHRMLYYYYITNKGTIKEMPMDDSAHPTYVPKDAMRPFYDHREELPDLYAKAVKYYWKFIRDMGGNYGTEYVVHQHRPGDETLQYYTIDSATQEPVIKTSSPLHDSAYRVPSSIRTPSPLETRGGTAEKKKSNI